MGDTAHLVEKGVAEVVVPKAGIKGAGKADQMRHAGESDAGAKDRRCGKEATDRVTAKAPAEDAALPCRRLSIGIAARPNELIFLALILQRRCRGRQIS